MFKKLLPRTFILQQKLPNLFICQTFGSLNPFLFDANPSDNNEGLSRGKNAHEYCFIIKDGL